MFAYIDTWQFHLVGFLITNVIFFQFYKSAVKDAKHDGAATIILQTVAGVSILVLAPFMPFVFPTDPWVWGLLILACIFYAINDRLQTTSRKHLEVSSFSILNQFVTVFLIIYGFTLFQEPITGEKVNGAMLILFGNILLFYKQGRFTFNKYTIMAIVASFSLATAISIDIGITQHFNLPFYVMITLLLPALFIIALERIHPRKILKEYNRASFTYYLIAGSAWALSIFFALRSFQLGEMSVLVPLQSTVVLLNVITATIIHRETANLHRKIIAAGLVILGVYITTLTTNL